MSGEVSGAGNASGYGAAESGGAEAGSIADRRSEAERQVASEHRPADRIARPVATRSGGRGFFFLVIAAGLVVAVLLGIRAVGVWPDWRNPFAEQRTDRTQPPLLRSIQDLSRYVAAEGTYQVVVDLQKDRRFVPDFLLNERTLFVGVGTVEAYVDFSRIADDAVVESAEEKSVHIALPAPELTDARLDLSSSYVFAEERGVLNRLNDLFGGDPNRQREVYQLAEDRISAAARDSGLVERAEENTRKMLTGLLRSLGYEQVTIEYVAP